MHLITLCKFNARAMFKKTAWVVVITKQLVNFTGWHYCLRKI